MSGCDVAASARFDNMSAMNTLSMYSACARLALLGAMSLAVGCAADTGGDDETTEDAEAVAEELRTRDLGVDPFDAASCTGDSLTESQARQRFAPASIRTTLTRDLTIVARKRECADATGCGAWVRTSRLPYRTSYDAYGHVPGGRVDYLRISDATTPRQDLFLSPRRDDLGRVRLETFVRLDRFLVHLDQPLASNQYAIYGVARCDVGRCPAQADSVAAGLDFHPRPGAPNGGVTSTTFTKSCGRIAGKVNVPWQNKLGRTETEYVFFSRL
jgi:hypothetical protein